jgi:hypothetical protein
MSSGGMYFDTATRRTGEEEAAFAVERTEERDEVMCCCLDWDDMLRNMCLVRRRLFIDRQTSEIFTTFSTLLRKLRK